MDVLISALNWYLEGANAFLLNCGLVFSWALFMGWRLVRPAL